MSIYELEDAEWEFQKVREAVFGKDARPQGSLIKTLCPFHQEKTASFVYWPKSRNWLCHGCHHRGTLPELPKSSVLEGQLPLPGVLC